MRELPTGIDDFTVIRSEDYYYVDKTMLLTKIQIGKVLLFTRPRRFGKSLNMSMLQSFYEVGCDKSLFEGLKVMKNKAFCEKYMGKYPVISITLKGVDGPTFEDAKNALASVIATEAMRFNFLQTSEKLTIEEKELYRQLIKVDTTGAKRFDISYDSLVGSLDTLSKLLTKHYGVKTVIIIDEYDVPLDKAHLHGYYNEMVELIRSIFHAALKTNKNLAFAVLTGCLKISKESIFTGLNNLDPYSISDNDCDSFFGFTEEETLDILKYYNLSGKKEEVKQWYDGYKIGGTDMYCPWDVLMYTQRHMNNENIPPQNYWANSSGNDLVREFVSLASEKTSGELENLVNGGSLEKYVNESLTYRNLAHSIENIWSVLYATGYLTGELTKDGLYALRIPNKEVQSIFEEDIIKWFTDNVSNDHESGKEFYDAAISGNSKEMQLIMTRLLQRSISLRDTYTRKNIRENFYHGFILGLLSGFDDIDSNSESGDGYSDITIKNYKKRTAVILELKYAESDSPEAMEKACDGALNQIDGKKYPEPLARTGLFDTIYEYGLAFNKKLCQVKLRKYVHS